MLDISIVIPAYKARPFIEETVHSILNQKGVKIDLSVAIQGPDDGTRELLEKIAKKDPRLKIYTGPVGAAKENWQFISKQATGRYIKLVPQDDVLLPGILQRQFELLESNPNAVLTASLREIIDDHNQVIKKSWGLYGLNRPMPGEMVIRRVVGLGLNALGEPGGVLMKRDVFERAGGWDFSHPYVVDLETYLNVLASGEFVPDRVVGVKFRVSSGQWTAELQDVQSQHVIRMNQTMHQKYPNIVTTWVLWRGNLMAKAMQSMRFLIYKVRGMK
ncbi:glycosyltransferase family 2 protein [Leuconostoc holzapfelii]|uniref:Glycosyltransferase family 2 protein n=1 Tax=Leuconostoc holzapfelii TaxID=434464 RepID=A0A846ZG62_9LACO|nr:glycosyltransferase family 2 protein [Leuconostoc holzapfelii]MCT8389936.1 glycosyltransferase family 2 protein [Leuconostoc holzapfelii]NKZ18709.1 glycosyltransferase family 2 protein [Leuconostoc holzapfelii]